MTYTVERITTIDQIDPATALFLVEESATVAKMYGDEFDSSRFDYYNYVKENLFLICRRDGHPVGMLLASIFRSGFDSNVVMLYQDLIYSKYPGTRTAFVLMQEFIDFGKMYADHVFSVVTKNANLKPQSLQRLGFEKIEEVFQLRVSNGQKSRAGSKKSR